MRRCLTKFSCIFKCGAVQKFVNLVDLVKSFPTSIYLQNLASIQPSQPAENEILKVCQSLPNVIVKVRKTIGSGAPPAKRPRAAAGVSSATRAEIATALLERQMQAARQRSDP